MFCYKLLKASSLLAAVFLLSPQTIVAKDLNMKVFDDVNSGRAALYGNYNKAIEIAAARVSSDRSYTRMVEATSLCVAYTKTAKFDEAEKYCKEAVNMSVAVDKGNRYSKFIDDNGYVISLYEIANNNYEILLTLRGNKDLAVKL